MVLFVVGGLTTLGCDPDPAPGTGPDGGGSGAGPAWTDGPVGHVYVYAGPLYDVDSHDGRILRTIALDSGARSLQATADHVYFKKFDDAGTGRIYSIGLDSDLPVQLASRSNTMVGIVGDTLVGILNSDTVVLVDRLTGATTEVATPPSLTCSNGSTAGTTLYLVCFRYTSAIPDAGLVTFDVGTRTFGTFVVVKPAAMTISMASNVTATPAGVLFVLYEGGASAGTRVAYMVDPISGSVSTGVPISGTSDDLDEQEAIGDIVYLTLFPSDQIVPFDVATMTARAPIAITRPRHIRAGGGMLWSTQHLQPATLTKIDPATGTMALRGFPILESSQLDSLAYGGE